MSLVIAHRGASASRPENTHAAFSHAIELGADMIEFDVRRTLDRQLIIHHDATVDGRLIASLNYAELMALPGGSDIPLLESLLSQYANRVSFDVELKEAGYEDAVISMMKSYCPYGDYLITSFLDTALAAVKTFDPNVTTGLLVGHEKPWHGPRIAELFPFGRMRRLRADVLVANRRLLPFLEARAALRRTPLYVWTVDDYNELQSLFADTRIDGVITDMPSEAVILRLAANQT